MNERVHACLCTNVRVCIWAHRSLCACLPMSVCACTGEHGHVCVLTSVYECASTSACGACFCVFVSLCAHTCECCIFSLGRFRRLWRLDIAMKVDTKTGPGEGAGPAPPDTYMPWAQQSQGRGQDASRIQDRTASTFDQLRCLFLNLSHLRASCHVFWFQARSEGQLPPVLGEHRLPWHVPTCSRLASGDPSPGSGGLLFKTPTVVGTGLVSQSLASWGTKAEL